MTAHEIRDILADENPQRLEHLARRAKSVKEQYFGRAVALYAPLYVSNYCSSHCSYCGFSVHNKIDRLRLSPWQIEREAQAIARMRIQNILILTGESYKATPVSYLVEAARIAARYFPSINLEVHPMETDEYRRLFDSGVDGVTVYQETYDRRRYAQVHLSGKKKDYDFRLDTPRRAAEAGMRNISLGILLGLAEDTAADVHALYEHLRFMEKHYPGVEYSLSFPRLRPIKGMGFVPGQVDDRAFFKILCLTRILFPRVGINLSTREAPQLRDRALEVAATKISAASKTSVGGYALLKEEDQEPQFDIQDHRSVDEVIRTLKEKNFDPVLTDWRRIPNRQTTAPA